jgi:hypothetical protein
MTSLIFVVNWIAWFWKYVQVAVPSLGRAVWLLKELITCGERQYACSNNWNSTAPFNICAVQSVICYFSCYCFNLVISAHNSQLMYIYTYAHQSGSPLFSCRAPLCSFRNCLVTVYHIAENLAHWCYYSTYCNTEILSLFSVGAHPALRVSVTGHNTHNKQDTLFIRRNP